MDLVEYFVDDSFEIIQKDGKIWINDASGLIGRYSSRREIDIHSQGTCDECRTGDRSFDDFISSTI